ncbi:hypothetical protein ABI59_07385 [Acidobacteria bacterium Mor1]|nr:hypothetical protein ABI59_07385 [Acidobacteria bacterium Mor1]
MEILATIVILGGLILLPVLLLTFLAKLAIRLILLPFKLVGALFGVLAGVLGAAVSAVLALLAVVFGVVLVPLLPLLLLGGILMLFIRLIRPRPVIVQA